MSERDVDAEFADIVAHWDDVAAPTERGISPAGPDPEREHPCAGGAPPEGRSPVNPSPLSPANPPPVSPVNPPPGELGGWPVWRGAAVPADPGPSAEEPVDAGSPEDVDDDEHFEPGPTAPLPPQEDLSFWGIIVGLVAGPLLLLWLVIFRPDVSGWWTLGALGLTVGGFALLVLRQPHTRDGDDPDDGARV